MIRTILLLLVLDVLPMSAGADFDVGVLIPLSGPIAGMGESFRRGISLREEETGRPHVRFLIEDHKYDGKTAVTEIEKLHALDGARVTIVWGNTPSSAVVPVSERKGYPVISVTFDPLEDGREHVFAIGPRSEELVQEVSNEFSRNKVKNAGALSIDIGDTLQSVEQLKALHGGMITKIISNDETDFKPYITLFKSYKVDAVFLLAFSGQSLTFLKQAAAMDFHPIVIGGDVNAQDEYRREAIALNPKVKFVYGAAQQDFIERIRSRFGDSSYFFETATAYSLATVIDRVASHLALHPSESVEEALRSVDLSGLPLEGLRFKENGKGGGRFEVDPRVYSAGF